MCTLSGLPEHLLTYLYSDWLELQGLVRLSLALSRADEKTLLTDIMSTASFCNSTKTFDDALGKCDSPTDLVNAVRWLNAKIGKSEEMRLSIALSPLAVLELERCCSDQTFRFIHKIIVECDDVESDDVEEEGGEDEHEASNVGDWLKFVEGDEDIDGKNGGEDEDDNEAGDSDADEDENENAENEADSADEDDDEDEDGFSSDDDVDHRCIIQHDIIGKWFHFAEILSVYGHVLPFDKTLFRSMVLSNPKLSLKILGTTGNIVRDVIRLGVAGRVSLLNNDRVDHYGPYMNVRHKSIKHFTNLQDVHLIVYRTDYDGGDGLGLATVKSLPHLMRCCWDNGENAPPVKLSANFFDDWSTTTLSTLRLRGFVCNTDAVAGLFRNHGHSLLHVGVGHFGFERYSLSDKGQLAVSFIHNNYDLDDDTSDADGNDSNDSSHASDPHLFDLAQAIPPISKLVLSPNCRFDVFAIALALHESSRHVISELTVNFCFEDDLWIATKALVLKPLFQHLTDFVLFSQGTLPYSFDSSDLNKFLGYLTLYSPFLVALGLQIKQHRGLPIYNNVLQQLLSSKNNLRRLCLELQELNHSMILSTLTEVSVRTGHVFAFAGFPGSTMPRTVVSNAIASGLKIKGLQYEDVAWVNLPEPLTVAELRDRRLVQVKKPDYEYY